MPEKTLHEALVDVADAIRAKTSSQETMTIEEMPAKIASIETGIIPEGTKSIVANGNGIDVYNYASVNVQVPSVQPSGTLEVQANGTYDVAAYGSVDVKVPGEVINDATFDTTFDYVRKLTRSNPSGEAAPFLDYSNVNTYAKSIMIDTRTPWTRLPDSSYDFLNGFPGGWREPAGINQSCFIIAAIYDVDVLNSSTEWTLSLGVTYTDYKGEYTEEEVRQALESNLYLPVYDLAGHEVGHLSSLSINVTLEEGC